MPFIHSYHISIGLLFVITLLHTQQRSRIDSHSFIHSFMAEGKNVLMLVFRFFFAFLHSIGWMCFDSFCHFHKQFAIVFEFWMLISHKVLMPLHLVFISSKTEMIPRNKSSTTIETFVERTKTSTMMTNGPLRPKGKFVLYLWNKSTRVEWMYSTQINERDLIWLDWRLPIAAITNNNNISIYSTDTEWKHLNWCIFAFVFDLKKFIRIHFFITNRMWYHLEVYTKKNWLIF